METSTIDDALTVMGFGKFQAFVLAYAGMGWVLEAMQLMLLSFLGSLVQEEWKISSQDVSLLSSVVFAGMLIGSSAWGFVSDKYGRRYRFSDASRDWVDALSILKFLFEWTEIGPNVLDLGD